MPSGNLKTRQVVTQLSIAEILRIGPCSYYSKYIDSNFIGGERHENIGSSELIDQIIQTKNSIRHNSPQETTLDRCRLRNQPLEH